jgi:hypothetical protein
MAEVSPTLFCLLHPAAEEIEFELKDPEHIVVSANTTTVGPGYHMFLSTLLKDWANDFGASWEPEDDPEGDAPEFLDETGFFFTGDQARLYEEMTRWLQALANTFFDGTFDLQSRGTALCMPINPQFDADETAITSVGPRDRAWLTETAEDGRRGSDFFAWWSPGLDAKYFLRRALVQMWTNVRWRRPALESEELMLAEVAECLRSAHALDPSLAYPWAEWADIADYLDDDSDEREWLRKQVHSAPTVGYRRRDVVVSLPGGWSMKVPGSFTDFELDGESDLCALDPPREIWFTAYESATAGSSKTFETAKKALKKTRPEFVYERDRCISEAKITNKQRDTGEHYFVLNSSTHAPAKRIVCTILFSESGDREWALNTWRSIQPPSE